MSFKKPIVAVITVDPADIAEIRIEPDRNNRALYTRRPFKENEVIIDFSARSVHSTPSYLTVQISDHEHIELFPECLECINHSCDPNCFFDTARMELVSLKDIEDGEELTFFYPSAEWNMDQAFRCTCGSKDCVGVIQGARYLSAEATRHYRFTEFIKAKLASR